MILEFFSIITENIILFIGKMGYFGIFLGMVIESTVFPLPSELILIPAGVLVSRGEFSFLLLILVSIIGNVLGALINYSVALFVGRKTINVLVSKYGKFFFITENGMKRSEKMFNGYGEISTFIGRLIPGVRHLISLPAGFFKMKLRSFLLFTALGSGIWACFLIGIGYFFNRIPIEIWKGNYFVFYILPFFVCMIFLIIYLLVRKTKLRKYYN